MSMDSSSEEPFMADLKNMERVVEIFEILGGKSEPQVANLVTPYRKWVRTEDVMVREAPFSASQKIPHRIFLFKDLLIIGRHKEPNRAGYLQGLPKAPDNVESKTAEQPAISKRRSFRLSFSRRKSTGQNLVNGGAEKRGSATRLDDGQYKVKLTHYLPLAQCTVKSIGTTLDNAYGMQLTHVCRVRTEKDGKLQVVTKVEKLEFWFPTKEQRNSLEQELGYLIEEEEFQQQIATDHVTAKRNVTAYSAAGESTTSTGGERAWARNRPKSIRARQKVESADFGRSRGGSGDSEETTATTQRDGISLADLARRYNVDFAEKPSLKDVAKFSVEFGEGQMGFSLSSGEGIGVIIGRLAPGSFADLGGCEIGDRLESVNGVEIDMDMPWQRAVEVIKAAGRPVTLQFVRNVHLQEQIHKKEQTDKEAAAMPTSPNATPSSPSLTQSNGATTAPATPGKRRWAQNRARHQSGQGGLIGLDDLERMYQSTAVVPDRRETAASSVGSSNKDDDDDTGSVVAADDDENAITVRSGGSFDATMSSFNLGFSGTEKLGPTNGKAILESFAATCDIEEERVCVSVLAEILATEKAYVSDLRALIKDYVIPLRRATKRKKCRDLDSASLMCEHGSLRSSCSKQSSESGPLLSPDDVRTIFMNVETLVKVNAELLKAIEEGLNNDDISDASDVAEGLTRIVEVFSSSFEKITPFFTMYALYCHQYIAATERLQKLRTEEEEVDTFLREREAKSSQTSLRSLLIKPVQRICRYPLLFQELLKRISAVEQVYPDRKKANIHLTVEVIQQTAQTVQKIADDVDKKVQVQETIGSIMTVFQELGGASDGGDERVKTELLAPSRRFVRAYEVFYKEAPFDMEMQPRKLYLFNDLIILAEEREGGGGGGGTLHSTLKRKSQGGTARSRARSFGNIMSGFMGDNKSSNLSAGGDEPASWSYQPTHWIDLHSGDVRPLPKPDEAGWYGLRLKSIKRTTVDKSAENPALERNKSAKRITWGAGVKDNQSATSRVVTSIHKYELWMHTRETLQKVLTDIEDKIIALSVLQQNASKGMTKFGGTTQRKTRSWTQKKNSNGDQNGSALPSRKSTSGSIDARDALDTISKKYSTRFTAKSTASNEEE